MGAVSPCGCVFLGQRVEPSGVPVQGGRIEEKGASTVIGRGIRGRLHSGWCGGRLFPHVRRRRVCLLRSVGTHLKHFCTMSAKF
jgi:hypothetical protein